MSKRKRINPLFNEEPEEGDDSGAEETSTIQPKKKRKEKASVSFADQPQTVQFKPPGDESEESESDETGLVGAHVEGDKIARVKGEEEAQEWSDEEEVPIEPFNLRAENREGYFDLSGNYVENKIEKGVKDAWLDEYDEKWAKEFEKKKPAKEPKSTKDEEEDVNRTTLLQNVCDLLSEKENVLAALKRYSGKGKEAKDMDKFNKLTEAADILLHNGYTNIYSDKKATIEDQLEEEQNGPTGENNGEDNTHTAPTTMWEYKGLDGVTYGPYTTAHMRNWRDQGYFSEETGVLVRQAKQDDMFAEEKPEDGKEDEFVSVNSVSFDLYP